MTLIVQFPITDTCEFIANLLSEFAVFPCNGGQSEENSVLKENRLVCEKEKSFQYFKKIVFLSQMSQCQITDCMTRSAGGHGTFKEDVSCIILELEMKVREDFTYLGPSPG